MAYNRELSQFASFVEVGVNNTIGIKTSVGIGTTQPATNLQIVRNADPIVSNDALISLKHFTLNSAFPYAGINIDHYCQNTGLNQGGAFIQFLNNGTQEALIQYDDDIGVNNGLLIKNNTDGPIYFQTNGSNERLRITSAGNVGIGTTNPREKLEVSGALIVNTNTSNLLIYNPGTGYSGTMIVNDSFHTALNGKVTGTDGGTGQIVIGGTVIANTAGSNFNILLGYGTTVNTKTEAIAIGHNATAGDYALALGYNANAPDNSAVINVGNSERLRITSNGNVGIGTTNPQANLHVYGTSTVSSQIIEAQNSASYAAFEVKSGIGTTAISGLLYSSSDEGSVILRNNSNTTGTLLGFCGTQSAGPDLVIFRETRNVVIGNNPSIASQTGTANQKLQVQSGAYISGSVGIGTTNPQYKLQVQGNIFVGNDPIPSTIGINTASIFLYGVPKRGIYWAPTSDTHYVKYDSTIIDGLTINGYSGLVFSTGSTTNATWAERMRMDINGNLGIGTTNPQYKLHVVGDAYVTGAFGIGSSLTVNGSIYPSIDATYDLGSPTNSWRNIYTNDLNLSNEKMDKGNDIDGTKGNWTIQEGEDHLYIINNKNGKKYKFFLEEIS